MSSYFNYEPKAILNHGAQVTVLNELGKPMCEGTIVGRSFGMQKHYDIVISGGKARLNSLPSERVVAL